MCNVYLQTDGMLFLVSVETPDLMTSESDQEVSQHDRLEAAGGGGRG